MAITATTLSAAAGKSDLTISVASATGITAPNFTTGAGITVLQIDQEYLLVTGSGSFSKIAVSTLNCDLPVNARWPVTIS